MNLLKLNAEFQAFEFAVQVKRCVASANLDRDLQPRAHNLLST